MMIAGTGSRSLRNEDNLRRCEVWDEIVDLLVDKKPDMVMSGMAEGFDEMLARVALDLRIPLWCAIPNQGYGQHYWGLKSLSGDNRWPDFLDILEKAKKITYVMEEVHHSEALYYRGRHSNFWRNDFMVEKADEFLVYNPESRGTKQCFGSILTAGKPYTIVGSDG